MQNSNSISSGPLYIIYWSSTFSCLQSLRTIKNHLQIQTSSNISFQSVVCSSALQRPGSRRTGPHVLPHLFQRQPATLPQYMHMARARCSVPSLKPFLCRRRAVCWHVRAWQRHSLATDPWWDLLWAGPERHQPDISIMDLIRSRPDPTRRARTGMTYASGPDPRGAHVTPSATPLPSPYQVV
jgi:hypothetical protein